MLLYVYIWLNEYPPTSRNLLSKFNSLYQSINNSKFLEPSARNRTFLKTQQQQQNDVKCIILFQAFKPGARILFRLLPYLGSDSYFKLVTTQPGWGEGERATVNLPTGLLSPVILFLISPVDITKLVLLSLHHMFLFSTLLISIF